MTVQSHLLTEACSDSPEFRAATQEDSFGRKTPGPLAGIVVADFSRVLAGPYCTMLLADMGATVLKVESPAGDETRTWKPPIFEGQSTYYLSINRNKRSIALDFKNPRDLNIARDIARRADVVVENFKPGGLDQFGLEYATIAACNPAVIYASITGFGSAAGSSLPGYDLLVQAMSGMMSLTGEAESTPYRSGVAVFDVMTGLHAAMGVLAALHQRDKNGTGQHIEVNLMSSALSGMVNQTAGYLLSGQTPTRMGNEHPSIYPYGPFTTQHGDLVLTIGNDRQFATLCLILGAPALSEDARFQTPHNRSENRSELRPILEHLLSQKPAADWFASMTDAGLPCAPINDVQGGIDFATRIGLDPVIAIGSGANTIPGVRHPITFSQTPVSYDLIPPAVDADRQDILHWLEIDTAATGSPPTTTPAATIKDLA